MDKAKITESIAKMICAKLLTDEDRSVIVTIKSQYHQSARVSYPKYYIQYQNGASLTVDDANIKALIKTLKSLPTVYKVKVRRPMIINVITERGTLPLGLNISELLDTKLFDVISK